MFLATSFGQAVQNWMPDIIIAAVALALMDWFYNQAEKIQDTERGSSKVMWRALWLTVGITAILVIGKRHELLGIDQGLVMKTLGVIVATVIFVGASWGSFKAVPWLSRNNKFYSYTSLFGLWGVIVAWILGAPWWLFPLIPVFWVIGMFVEVPSDPQQTWVVTLFSKPMFCQQSVDGVWVQQTTQLSAYFQTCLRPGVHRLLVPSWIWFLNFNIVPYERVEGLFETGFITTKRVSGPGTAGKINMHLQVIFYSGAEPLSFITLSATDRERSELKNVVWRRIQARIVSWMKGHSYDEVMTEDLFGADGQTIDPDLVNDVQRYTGCRLQTAAFQDRDPDPALEKEQERITALELQKQQAERERDIAEVQVEIRALKGQAAGEEEAQRIERVANSVGTDKETALRLLIELERARRASHVFIPVELTSLISKLKGDEAGK